jgi:hypothetical protein
MKISHIATVAATLILSLSTNAQNASTKDPLQSLAFLQGTWKANTYAEGSSGGTTSGTYTFALDLNGHPLQRTSSVDKCSGPNSFDCQHHDQLTVYAGILAGIQFHESPSKPIWAGGAFIVVGGLIMTFWHPK